MNTTNERIIEQLQEKLSENFEEPLHEWVDTIDSQAVFNYPSYFDNGQFDDEIKAETDFITNQIEWLKEQGYKGFLYVGNYVIDLN
jgi:hypothetical protein